MRVVSTVEALRVWRGDETKSIGLVPTMGALHEGHLSLVRRARRECDRVVVSIFVNPAQFNATEDLRAYPRDLPADLRMLADESVDVVFTPTEPMMYPPGYSTWVVEESLARRWEGASRPGHFRGVATIVLKLLNLVQAERAYFGEKDYQQLRVVERMVQDLAVPTAIVPCPTVRETDGLAMSSRNARLASPARRAATVIWRGLSAARDSAARGERDGENLRRLVEATIRAEPLARVDYVAVVDPETLEPLTRVGEGGAVCCVAAWLDDVRLIDNLRLI